MTRNRSLVAGLTLLLSLAGCSEDKKVVNAVGSYAPIITGLHIDREPAVRGQDNVLSVLVTNVNAIGLAYHWRASTGLLQDSTSQSVTWSAPDSITTATIYVSITGTDENDVSFFKEKNFAVFVDNEYVRWTSGETVRFDVAPPVAQAPDPAHPVVCAEFENVTTGESRIVSLDRPLATPVSLTAPFFAASGPTISASGTQVAFAGRVGSGDPGVSVYVIPGTGAGSDTTSALPIQRYRANSSIRLGNPRFARAGTFLMYNSDSGSNLGIPKPWIRDAATLLIAPRRLISGEGGNAYWLPNWGPDDAFVVSEAYRFFGSSTQQSRGLYKLRADTTVATGTQWLPDSSAMEPDWSADGTYIVYAKRNPAVGAAATERDIWIIRADTSDRTRAIRVTSGPADDGHPRFSHDGSTIYFLSNRGDRYGLNGLFPTERRGYNVWTVSGFDLPQ